MAKKKLFLLMVIIFIIISAISAILMFNLFGLRYADVNKIPKYHVYICSQEEYDKIPFKYDDNIFSVRGFLSNKDKYIGQSVDIKGTVSFIYQCPKCPAGAMCKSCANNYIYLIDPIKGITYKNQSEFFRQNPQCQDSRIIINFPDKSQVYNDLKINQQAVVNITYTNTKERLDEAVGGSYGTFLFNSIKEE